jgi:hypothetical protein
MVNFGGFLMHFRWIYEICMCLSYIIHVHDIAVMIDVCVYIYILPVKMERKNAILGLFAECFIPKTLVKVCVFFLEKKLCRVFF